MELTNNMSNHFRRNLMQYRIIYFAPHPQTAKVLAGANARLVWGCRNKEKAIQKKEEIR